MTLASALQAGRVLLAAEPAPPPPAAAEAERMPTGPLGLQAAWQQGVMSSLSSPRGSRGSPRRKVAPALPPLRRGGLLAHLLTQVRGPPLDALACAALCSRIATKRAPVTEGAATTLAGRARCGRSRGRGGRWRCGCTTVGSSRRRR
jgi:hypothetical protein